MQYYDEMVTIRRMETAPANLKSLFLIDELSGCAVLPRDGDHPPMETAAANLY